MKFAEALVAGTLLLCLSVETTNAMVCEGLDEESCTGCASSKVCTWQETACVGIEDKDGTCGDVTITEEATEPCQLGGSYPFYYTEAAAIKASPTGGAHAMGNLYMPNDVPESEHGTYVGDAPTCQAEGESHDDHHDHDHDHDEKDDHEHLEGSMYLMYECYKNEDGVEMLTLTSGFSDDQCTGEAATHIRRQVPVPAHHHHMWY
ncbi:hypothetical protein CYMTET_48239 [Cymbomonas tetramitiformis]|uniref:Uncharacterized protein n=1 Tax=Cymbomonas tetramitiformis TaxID=36881 RepID=A0AAE0EVC5_9CHLO|nr:hypothetical protein CYMTET_48239 [Cymbomonas tetramitiformis]